VGLVFRNVADLVDFPRVKKKQPTIWTPDQAKKFLEHGRLSRFFSMHTLAYIGLREGEILCIHIEVMLTKFHHMYVVDVRPENS
jgi:hypothetical protein